MASKVLVPVEEYLRMSFDGPDRDFVDGEIVERNMGNKLHSRSQGRLVGICYEFRKSTPLWVMPELRCRLDPQRYRVLDIGLFVGEPEEDVPSTPPLAVIEIVSPDDRMTEIVKKLEDYRTWGVANIWLIDPYLRKAFLYSSTGFTEVRALDLPDFSVSIPLSEVFA